METFIDLVDLWKTLLWAEEQGQIAKSLGPFIAKRMRERQVYCYRDQYVSAADKPTQARSIQARMSMGRVYLPRHAPWVDELVGELLRFPAGKYDDQIDVLSLFGRMLDRLVKGTKAAAPKRAVTEQPTLNDLLKEHDRCMNSRKRL